MNILFISIGDVSTLRMDERGVYTDLVREMKKQGHEVYVVCSRERRYGKETSYAIEAGIHVLRVKTGNITKANLLEKGLSIIAIDHVFKKSIKKYFKGVCFDLVMYSTPPITLTGIIDWAKKRYRAISFLMLKDIFPQNAVDLGIIRAGSLLYRYFRRKEKRLYAISDRIGCMSPANISYVLKYNPEIDTVKVVECPNCIDAQDMTLTTEERIAMRNKYEIPLTKKIFVYGGNLGRPQDIPFIIDCLRSVKNADAFFLIVGSGTEYGKLENFVNDEKPANVKLMKSLPKVDYDRMIVACDVGLLFLDHRFTIPNFPSRLLDYMQAGLPVLACTDPNTDVGKVIVEGGFGWWCESNNTNDFIRIVDDILKQDLTPESERSYSYLVNNYSVKHTYQAVKVMLMH